MTSSSRVVLSYCAEEVRRHDRGRYLCTLLAPATRREPLFALYAFDYEITKVAAVVSQPMTGLIRLQWWRDALEGIAASTPVAHPVVAALHDTLGVAALPRAQLDDAIDGRERQLDAEPPATLAALEQRFAKTHSSVVRAALGILGVNHGAAHEVARHTGIALGLVELLHRSDAERLPPDIRAADLARCARTHLDAARQQGRHLPRHALAALLPARLADDDLSRLARVGYDPSAAAERPRAMAPVRLVWCLALGRF